MRKFNLQKGIQIENSKIKITIVVIASLILGIGILFFIPQTHDYVVDSFLQIWFGIIWTYEALLTSYTVPLWVLIIISVLALTTIIRFLINLQSNTKPEHLSYKEDFIYGANWRWKWTKNEIVNVECYCPKCDSVLVYDESSCHTRYTDVAKTDFICENCNSQLVTTIHGGNKKYAINAIKREIERRIRTEEYKSTINKSI